MNFYSDEIFFSLENKNGRRCRRPSEIKMSPRDAKLENITNPSTMNKWKAKTFDTYL